LAGLKPRPSGYDLRMDAAAKPGRLRQHDRLKVTEVSSAAVAAPLAVILRSVFCDEGSPSCPDFNTEARVCTYMPSHHRVIMHRFRLKTRRGSGQEGVTMHHAVDKPSRSQLIQLSRV
jgi:hypothetical protein